MLRISRETVNLWLIICRVQMLVRHRQWQQRTPLASIVRRMLIAAGDRGQTAVTVNFNSSDEEATSGTILRSPIVFFLAPVFRDESSPWMTMALRDDEIELASVADR